MSKHNLTQQQTSLNEQQLEMLRLFKSPMSKKDYEEVKRMVVKLLARNVDSDMEKLEKENGWTKDTYDQWGKEHMRTPYK